MLDANKIATAFFRDVLHDPVRGEAGARLPGQARGRRRGVGEVPARLRARRLAPARRPLEGQARDELDRALKLCGPCVRRQLRAGGYYDTFRDRLVCLADGRARRRRRRVLGASDREEPRAGHRRGPRAAPKYINSPESAFLTRRASPCSGWPRRARRWRWRGGCVLVEGNFDVITLHQGGFGEAHAPLAHGADHRAGRCMLKRLTDRIVLLYDGDKAGYKATIHALQMCFEAEIEVSIAQRFTQGGEALRAQSLAAPTPTQHRRAAAPPGCARRSTAAVSGFEYFCFEVWGRGKTNAGRPAAGAPMTPRKSSRKLPIPTKREANRRNVGVGTRCPAWTSPGARMTQGAESQGSRVAASGLGSANPVGCAPTDRVLRPRGPSCRRCRPDEAEVCALFADHPSLIASPGRRQRLFGS